MNTLLWTAAFVCWSIAALLVASIAYPDLLEPPHGPEEHPE